MAKLLTVMFAFAALALPAAAQTPTTPAPADQVSTPSHRTVYFQGQSGRYLVDGTWYFRQDAQNQGLAAHFERQTSTDGWSPTTVPNAWNATDVSDASDRGSIGWYRKDFTLPAAPRGVSWKLRFESVNYRAQVYLNGHYLGRHEGAFVPFEVAARYARSGVNRLVVRVDSRRRSTDIPPATDQANGRPGGGWWNYGGILREVYLREVRGVDVQRLLVRPTLRSVHGSAKVLFRATVNNATGRKRRVRVTGHIGGVRAHFRPRVVPKGASRTFQAVATVRRPKLWQPGSPHLYRASAQARAGGGASSEYQVNVGIRQIRVNSHGQMLLNGRRVELRGASQHEDSPDRGMALSPQQIMDNVGLLEQLHANVTRAHYPLHPLMLEECDRLGILVWEQIPFNRERFAAGGNGILAVDDAIVRSRAVRAKAIGYLRASIARDQNHPSVFAWSVANEPDPRPASPERHYMANAVRTVHRLDPTRLAAVDLAGYPNMPQEDTYDQFDAIGVNSYFGWYPGSGGTLDDRSGLKPFLGQMHRFYPHSALFVTEFGAEANRDGPVDEKGTYLFQRDFLNYHLDAYDNDPYINGAIVWILRDFRVQPGWDGGNPKPSPPTLKKGLVDEFGNKKPAFFDLARRFADTPPLR
jgi:beta-glucuronidase